MPKEPREKQEVLDELTDMFYEVQPDEDYLNEDEDTDESINDIKNLLHDEAAPIEKKIEALAAFNSDWFPDGLSGSEQKAYRDLIDKANKLNT